MSVLSSFTNASTKTLLGNKYGNKFIGKQNAAFKKLGLGGNGSFDAGGIDVQGEFGKRFNPIEQALTQQYAGMVDPTRRKSLGQDASAGFGLSGRADNNIANALAGLEAQKASDIAQQRSKILADVNTENLQLQQLAQAKQAGKKTGWF